MLHEATLYTRIVPGLNDSDDELKGIAGFLAGLDVNIPWHISRFHPQYKMGGKEGKCPECGASVAGVA